jgi:hypothetical protein
MGYKIQKREHSLVASISQMRWQQKQDDKESVPFTPPCTFTNIPPVSVSYLAAKSGGDQGGHDDHGDHDLDGGRDVT